MNVIIGTVSTCKKVDENEILSISIMNESGEALLDEIVRPVKSEIWEEAEARFGISPESVKNRPVFADIRKKVQRLIDKADTLIMYDVKRELELLSYGGIGIAEGKKIIDVSQEFSRMIGEALPDLSGYRRYTLEEAARYMGLSLFQMRSQENVIATKFVFDCMINNPKFRVSKIEESFYNRLITSRDFDSEKEAAEFLRMVPESTREQRRIEKIPSAKGYSYTL